MNLIIAIEGADGAGKCTQTQLLAEKLGGTRFAFPNYDSPTGKAILGHLKGHWRCGALDETESLGTTFMRTNDCDPLIFQCLQIVNRLELLPEINAALAKGPVIFDRYSASAMVYGALDGLDPKWIELINASLPQPDVWIYLDIPIEESFKRRPERRDRYESDRVYLEKVREGYLKLFAKPPHAKVWAVVDGLGTVEQVHERIMMCVPKPAVFPRFCVEGGGSHFTNDEGRCVTCGEMFNK